jgi:hypothetical protein
MSSLTIPSHNAPTPPAPMFTLTEAKAAFIHVLENVIENEDVTRALNDEGIDNIISLVKLTDDAINNLAYLDPDSKMRVKLKLGPIGCIKPFIHYVHFREETNPIGNDWISITMDHFDQFRVSLNYTRRFASVSSLSPLDMTYVNDKPKLLDAPDVVDKTDVTDVTDVDDASNALNVSDVFDESVIFTVTDDLDIADIIETTDLDSIIDVTRVSDVKIVVVDVPMSLMLQTSPMLST